jgi:hypothetical protein
MPDSDMMFAVRPMKYIGMNASSTETGIVTIGTSADGTCQRKIRITTLTITNSSRSECSSVPMARSMRFARS